MIYKHYKDFAKILFIIIIIILFFSNKTSHCLDRPSLHGEVPLHREAEGGTTKQEERGDEVSRLREKLLLVVRAPNDCTEAPSLR